jgi:perosamine synthetase
MDFIPLARPGILEEDIQKAAEVLRSGMLVQGKNVLALEKKFCELHGVRHAIALANGTSTLHLALLASGIKKGDEVIVPAFSYIATANVVELVGATPVFVDIESHTFNIDVGQIENKITPNTKAIIPVHEFGLSCDIAAIIQLAGEKGIPVIEDAACALGATQNQKLTGSMGHFGSFSLHPRKSITSGEGGMLLTNDDTAARNIRVYRNHGIDPDKSGMDFIAAGFNYRMTDFQAALALGQFDRLTQILKYKNEIAEIYFNEIKHPAITLPSVPQDHYHTWQTFHVLLEQPLFQKEVIEKLKSKNIGTNYGAQCIPAQTYYYNKYKLDSKTLFPNAHKAWTQGLAIPIYDRLTKEEAHYVAKTLNQL